MKYLQTDAFLGESEGSEDTVQSTVKLEMHIEDLEKQLSELPENAPADKHLQLTLDRCYGLLELNRFDDAWSTARQALDAALEAELWLRAVEACDVMFQSEQDESLKALAHGIWLGVTFPIDPELSVAMLQHMIDESPDRSDGAAVAAATAAYIVDLRAEAKARNDLEYYSYTYVSD